MSLRLFVDHPLSPDIEFALPEDAARHVQVRRLQPGDALRLFDGRGGQWQARVLRMGKRDVDVRVEAHDPAERELPFALEVAAGMPANERMDALVEKATELGAAAIRPLQAGRSVLRLEGERAARRVAHWQAVAAGASEQSGRTRVPVVAPVRTLAAWLDDPADAAGLPAARFVLSTGDAPPLARALAALPADARAAGRYLALSGPEGGLGADEEAAAVARGFMRVSLGPLVLRADTAPLAWLAQMAVLLAP
ncbi:MAG: 16S rRNA (uracil(1498)-N(3))-methyltransferase [Burkholderiaceae bacterium]